MKFGLDTSIRKPADSKHRRLGLVTAVAVFSLFTAGSAWCQQHYQVDPAASEVHFTLGASDHPVEGAFHVTSGDFTLDPQSGAMTGTVAVDATSGDSGNKGRDKTMTTKQLKAQTYPMVTFVPTKFSGQVKDSGDSTGQVDGNFTLLGQAHPITVPMTVHMEGDRFTASGSFMVPFVTWGVKDPSFMMLKVDKEVKIALKLAGTVSK
jgi:polyisoprenoid-binding protein YceI